MEEDNQEESVAPVEEPVAEEPKDETEEQAE